MNREELFKPIQEVALRLGFKRNTTDQWWSRGKIPRGAQIDIFKGTRGSISFEDMKKIEKTRGK